MIHGQKNIETEPLNITQPTNALIVYHLFEIAF